MKAEFLTQVEDKATVCWKAVHSGPPLRRQAIKTGQGEGRLFVFVSFSGEEIEESERSEPETGTGWGEWGKEKAYDSWRKYRKLGKSGQKPGDRGAS